MSKRKLKITALTLAAAALAGAGLALVLRDQMSRHRRDLFSPQRLRRLAALGYLGRADATVDHITLLRDFIAWEPRKLLRNRARSVLDRMEEEVRTTELDLDDLPSHEPVHRPERPRWPIRSISPERSGADPCR